MSDVGETSNNGSQQDIRNYLQRKLPIVEVPGVLDSDSGTSGRRDGVESNDNEPRCISMSRFAKQSKEAYQDLAKEIQKMGRGFLDYVNGENIVGSRRYLTDVIITRNLRERTKILEVLYNYGSTRRRGMFGYSVEDDHIHVIHDCSFSDGTCRDVWREQVESIGEIKPVRKENKPIWKFKRTDWYDVFIYFFVRKRGTREIWFGGESWKKPTDGKF